MEVLRERWPNYENDVAATLYSYERRVLDWRVRRIFATADGRTPELRVFEPDTTLDEHRAWQTLQADAIEAIAVEGECPPTLSRAASQLGVPFAERAAGEQIALCGARAVAAALSFPEAR
jgi:hypothetical protein